MFIQNIRNVNFQEQWGSMNTEVDQMRIVESVAEGVAKEQQ